VQIVQEHAMYLSNETRDASLSSTTQPLTDAALTYSAAATAAFRTLLQRIDTVSRHLRGRDRVPDVQIIDAVTAMLADPWIEDLRSQAQ
jgi:colicin import membrane protein